ncbi:MAG: DUF1640 domain-containing protein [Nitrospirae bacterium]|nr:DUF1640 domain-containing protein [Nitrospirota bacterium]MBF0540370.1 DUF1640 domain-containing protein [Nitrospirota bacterium]
MTTLTFDTYTYVKKLKAVGFTEEQAEVQAETIKELISEQLATKQDINDLKRDMKEMELRMTVKLGAIMTTGIAIVAAIVKLF